MLRSLYCEQAQRKARRPRVTNTVDLVRDRGEYEVYLPVSIGNSKTLFQINLALGHRP